MTVKLSATSFGFTRPENADRGTIAMLPVSSSAPAMTVSTRPSAKTEPVNSVGSVPHVFGSSPEETLMATRPPNAMYAPARKPATIILPKLRLLLVTPTSIPAAVLARGSLNGTLLPPYSSLDPSRPAGLARSQMEQRLSLIALGVADVPRARAFYEALGWTCNTDPAMDVAFFQLGGMVLAVWSREQLAEDSTVTDGGGWGGVTLAYNVRSPEEVDAALGEAEAAGATIGRPGAATFWGGYSGLFVDPDGHPWEVAHNPRWTIEPNGSVRI